MTTIETLNLAGVSLAVLTSGLALAVAEGTKRSAITKARRRAAAELRPELNGIQFRLELVETLLIQVRGGGPRLAEETTSDRQAV